MGTNRSAGDAVCDGAVFLRVRSRVLSERADGRAPWFGYDRRARRRTRRGRRRRDRRERHVGGGAESGDLAAGARSAAALRRAGLDDPGDGHRRLFRRLPHDRREKGLGHQKPNFHGQPDRAASIRTFLPRANTMARRSSTPKRLAANSSRSSCRAISPSGWSRTITGSAKNPTACT